MRVGEIIDIKIKIVVVIVESIFQDLDQENEWIKDLDHHCPDPLLIAMIVHVQDRLLMLVILDHLIDKDHLQDARQNIEIIVQDLLRHLFVNMNVVTKAKLGMHCFKDRLFKDKSFK